MSMLIIWKQLAAEDAHAPEFQFLLSVCMARARDVFGAVELHASADALPPRADAADYVLVLGREHVWLTTTSLRLMKQAIDAGAGRVEPARLSDCVLDGLEPLYTARDYDELERRVLAENRLPNARALDATAPVPVTLYSREAFARREQDHDQNRGHARGVGVCHQFSDYYGETRADLLPFLPPTARDVLEIGCGRGRTGRLLEQTLGCRVTGVELNPEVAADAAHHLSRVIVGDVLTVTIDGRYDAIIASELAEHLHDLDAFLIKMKALLKPDGLILLSIPNVGHYSVVEDLLAGRWDYVPAGLLCYTHLRFFTQQTLADWMARLGFRCTITPQLTELPERFAQMPDAFACDRESLRTKGFYVVLRP
jgi:SAM-dependent methyltransferase